ncbi:DUF2812 domain-containing protein [Virgibacillus alimentarius]|uniref:DUF2812 domain-containing protein n=1 Tax=Virgibacillus alimentarius TaxID=698769 RepID=UPI0004937C0B|nr:DUF2812 domain-containing protein [Virgibacillus alimentarius]
MKQTKYVSSGGLAFSEEKDMKKLSKYAKKGWILEGFAPFGYRLQKGEPATIQYSLDYQMDADEDYFAYFEAAGWSHVCSSGNSIHLFYAPVGTAPIYSDKETMIEKYETEKKKMGKAAFIMLIITFTFMFLGALGSYGWVPALIRNGSLILGYLSLIALIFTGMPYFGYRNKLNKLLKRS